MFRRTQPRLTTTRYSQREHGSSFLRNCEPTGKAFRVVGNYEGSSGSGERCEVRVPAGARPQDVLPSIPPAVAPPFQTIAVAIRTTGDPATVAASVRREFRNIDPNLPVLRVETVEEQLNSLLLEERLVAALSRFFGGLAALLACLGLYGVMAYTTARRSNEVGIRDALCP